MDPRSHRWALFAALLLSACTLSACTSSPPGETDSSYILTPATIFGPPASTNVFFAATSLSVRTAPFNLVTEPLAGHVDSRCTGTTVFEGSSMTVDWACADSTRTWTVDGTLTWNGKKYFGDCVTSFTGPTFSFANLIVPFEAL